MKLLVIGLGSMGKRRIRNLRHLGAEAITGFDPRADRRKEAVERYGITIVDGIEAGLDRDLDAVVISTPPDLHTFYALLAARRGLSFFTEASVVDDGMDELEREVARRGVVGAPSCTMRYYVGPQTIRQWVEAGAIGRPLTFVYQSGQWLPDWHPWEDYRTFYASNRVTGACREIVPFELTWLTEIFGTVAAVQAFKTKMSALEADIDDLYQALFQFASGVSGVLHVDVLARAPVRRFHLVGTEGSIVWDALDKAARLYRAATGQWEVQSLTSGTVEPGYAEWAAEEPYVDEMRDFIAAVRREKLWRHSLADDRRILRALYAAEESHAHGHLVRL